MIVFLAINGALGLAALTVVERGRSFSNAQTDSNLQITPEGAALDVLLLGSSRCRVLSRGRNHAALAEQLGDVLNLGRGGGGGVVPARLYLEHFLAHGNRAEVVVYFVDPFTLCSPTFNEQRFVYDDEPLDPRFMARLASHGVGVDVIANHVRSKFTLDYFRRGPWPDDHFDVKHGRALEQVDSDAVAKRLKVLYPDGVKAAIFARYAAELRALVSLARANARRVVLISPPTLLGEQPGMARVRALGAEVAAADGVEYHDLTAAMPEPGHYYNHDHLNSEGVARFLREHLRPLVR